jgi:hypothetical protein
MFSWIVNKRCIDFVLISTVDTAYYNISINIYYLGRREQYSVIAIHMRCRVAEYWSSFSKNQLITPTLPAAVTHHHVHVPLFQYQLILKILKVR